MVTEIVLTGGLIALVDDADAEALLKYKWRPTKSPKKKTFCAYRQISPGGKTQSIYMHREIMGLAYGDPREVDHRDHNGLNNRRENLRVVTKSQNAKWQPPREHSSQYRGVTWDTRKGQWRAQTQVNGKMFNLGHFATEETAAKARDAYVIRSGETFIRLNFPALAESSEYVELLTLLPLGNGKRRPRTHCLKGHPLTESNLLLDRLAKGDRVCKTCHRIYQKAYKQLQRRQARDRMEHGY